MKKIIALASYIGIFLITSVYASPNPVVIKQQLQSLIDDITSNQNIADNVPGISLAVKFGDQAPISVVSGFNDVQIQQPMQANNLLELGSVTKTYTAVLIMQLVEIGVLSLNETLANVVAQNHNDYASQLKQLIQQYPFLGVVTLEQLLNHTSGIYNYGTNAYDAQWLSNRYYTWTMPALVQLAASLGPILPNPSGFRFAYSNTNYTLLGMVIQAVTNQSYSAVLHTKIINQLLLGNTYYLPSDQNTMPKQQIAEGYEAFQNGNPNDPMYELFIKQPPALPVVSNYLNQTSYSLVDVKLGQDPSWTGEADGGIVATTADEANFTQALFTGELINPATLQTMLGGPNNSNLVQTNLNFANFDVLYGLGIYYLKLPNGEVAWAELGDEMGYKSGSLYFPKQNITISYALDTSSYAFGNSNVFSLLMTQIFNILQNSTAY